MFSHQIDAIKDSIIGLVLILATAIIGLGWIGYGLFAVFVRYLGPEWGPFALGGLFLLPLIIFFAVKLLPHSKKKRKQQAYSEAFANSSVGAISHMVDAMSGHSPIAATLVAVLGGFMASRFPQFLPMFAEIVSALGEELARRKVKKAEKVEREARADYERAAAAPPPPDVEPIKRRGRKMADY
ncbi:MAG: hypothetical protein ACXU8O_02640 [Asticcacaulis sp.]